MDSERDSIGKRLKNKLLSRFWTWTRIVSKLTMPNAEVDEAEIAKLVSDGGLKPETLARRKRVEKDVTPKQLKQNVKM